uniref:snRNA-activating protein complex subunit 4 n=1 Tax=Tetraselmis sp. GSL018 TaxID=582737 RepID=A0A061R8J6_9CHLO
MSQQSSKGSDIDSSYDVDDEELQQQLSEMRAALGSSYVSLSSHREQGCGEHVTAEDQREAFTNRGSEHVTLQLEDIVNETSDGDEEEDEEFLANVDFPEFDLEEHLQRLRSVLGTSYRRFGEAPAEAPAGEGERAEGASEPPPPAASDGHPLGAHEELLRQALAANRKAQRMIRSQVDDLDRRLNENAVLVQKLKGGLKKVRDAVLLSKQLRRPGCMALIRYQGGGKEFSEADLEKEGSSPRKSAIARVSMRKRWAAENGSLPPGQFWRDPSGDAPPDNDDTIALKPYYLRFPALTSVRERTWIKAYSSMEEEALKQGLMQTLRCKQMEGMIETIRERRPIRQSDITLIESTLSGITLATPGVAEEIEHFTDKDWEDVAAVSTLPLSGLECYIAWTHHIGPDLLHGPWTPAEDARLVEAVQWGSKDWQQVARHVGGFRSAANCLQRYQTEFNNRVFRNGNWTEEEKQLLVHACTTVPEGPSKWTKVAAIVGTRTPRQCLHRWTRRKPGDTTIKKGRWTKEEDEALRRAVAAIGVGRWAQIAATIPGRTDVQARERWVRRLNPRVHNSSWTPQEDRKLCEAVWANTSPNGHICWVQVAESFEAREANMCRRRWHCPSMRRYRIPFEERNPSVVLRRANHGAMLRQNAQPPDAPPNQPNKDGAEAPGASGSEKPRPAARRPSTLKIRNRPFPQLVPEGYTGFVPTPAPPPPMKAHSTIRTWLGSLASLLVEGEEGRPSDGNASERPTEAGGGGGDAPEGGDPGALREGPDPLGVDAGRTTLKASGPAEEQRASSGARGGRDVLPDGVGASEAPGPAEVAGLGSGPRAAEDGPGQQPKRLRRRGAGRASRCAMRRPKGRPRRAPPAARGRRLPSAPAAAGRRRGAVAGPLPGAGAARGPAKRPRAAACSASRTGRRSSCAGPTSSPRWSASTQGCGGTRRSSAGESALGDPCRRSRSPASSRRRMRRAACCSSSSP